MRVIFFLIDAFRYDYISEESTPFLWKCANEGKYVRRIIPSAGFCERTEIFTGLKPNESGYFTAIGYDPFKSPYKDDFLLKLIGKGESFLEGLGSKRLVYFYKKILLRLLKNKFIKSRLKPYQIPFWMLDKFNLTEDEFDHHQGEKIHPDSIFSLLKKKGIKFFYDSFTGLGIPSNGDDQKRLEIAINAFKSDQYSFLPIYLSNMDSMGHKYGPDGAEIKMYLKNIDVLIEEYVNKFLSHDSSTKFVFLGDHGMSKVTSVLDIKNHIIKLLKNKGYKIQKDYILFLDSTILRVWFLNDKAAANLTKILNQDELLINNGIVIDEALAKKYSLPYPDSRYGDFCWWANNGTLIFPDFFHNNTPYKGMHGYAIDDFDTHGMCISWGKNIEQSKIESLPLNEVYSELKHLLNV